MTIEGITEDDIANYLAQTPGFFERHAELLSSIQLTSPHGQRAVSLQERQMEMLRDRIKGQERKLVEMLRHGQENMSIADRLHAWTCAMLLTADARSLPAAAVQELQRQFQIPMAALRLWRVAPGIADEWFAGAVSDDLRTFVASLVQPYCGANTGFEAAGWLDAPSAAVSMALIPLRRRAGEEPFGLLVLGSPDPTRFAADMGTDFLARVGEIAGAAMARLLSD